MPTNHRRLTRLAVLAAGAILGASTITACAAGSGDSHTIRYQSYAGGVDVLQLADALGYLHGLKLDKVGDVTGGPQSLQALASHQVDISSSAFFGAIAQLEANGAPIKAVVSTYGSNAKVSEEIITLANSSIRTARDLIGKKVAVNTLGANEEAVIDTWLTKSGLTKSEIAQVTLVPLPPLTTFEALQNHQVDAAAIANGQLQSLTGSGLQLRVLVKDTDIIGDYDGGGFAVTDQYLQQNPAVARQLITGVAKAVAYIESHSRDDVLKIYDAWLTQNGYGSYIAAVNKNWAGSTGVAETKTAQITNKDFATWVTWLESRGTVKSNLNVGTLYTNAYNDLAKG